MDTVTEGKMLGLIAIELVFLGIGKNCRVVIGRAEEKLNMRPTGDGDACDGEIFGRIAIDELHGTAQTQELFDSARDILGMCGKMGQMRWLG
jgi:hypothetical protein